MNKLSWVLALWCGFSPMLHANYQVFGKRYCEIVYSKDYMDFYVYNTATVNDCPSSWWSSLNHHTLKKNLGASYVFLNGPRVWLVDEISNPVNHHHEHFNGKTLPRVASFHSNLQSLLKRHGPYVDYEVRRQQIYHMHAGKKVYELLNPDGTVYVLSSISLRHHQQSVHSLDGLAAKLHIPQGWKLKSGVIQADLELGHKNHMIHVIMDEFDNTYQKVDRDVLGSS